MALKLNNAAKNNAGRVDRFLALEFNACMREMGDPDCVQDDRNDIHVRAHRIGQIMEWRKRKAERNLARAES